MPSRATNYEKLKAKEHRGTHYGGPGKPDYTRGSKVGEVKDRQSPVTKPELQRMLKKGVTEVDSKGGFTEPAKGLAKKGGTKLFSRGQRLA